MMKGAPPCVPTSWTATTFGCSSAPAALASCSNRRTSCASCSPDDSTFSATSRSSFRSWATKTRPIPPYPSSRSTRYRSPRTSICAPGRRLLRGPVRVNALAFPAKSAGADDNYFRAPGPPFGRRISVHGSGASSAGTGGSGRRRVLIGDFSGFVPVRRFRLFGWRDQERDGIGRRDRPGGDQGNREPPLAHFPHSTILLPEALWSIARASALRSRDRRERGFRALEQGGATAALRLNAMFAGAMERKGDVAFLASHQATSSPR